jgi:hypothetical protein
MEFAALYVGSGLAPHLQACLRSWVDYGHSIDVYTYDKNLPLPPGVTRRDAGEIIASSRVYTYQSGMGKGSVSAFSNEFRYRVCHSRQVIWVDTDVLCLSGQWPEREYQFAWQSSDQTECNIAVFGAPSDSQLVQASLERIAAVDVTHAEFGQLGPVPFTETLRALGLESYAAPYTDFYPIGYNECEYFLDPQLREGAEGKMRDSYAVHLWNEVWTRSRIPTFMRPPIGSFMEAVYERHGIEIPIEARLSDVRALTFVDPNQVVARSDYEALQEWARSLEGELGELKTWAQDLDEQLQAHADAFKSSGRAKRLSDRLRPRSSPSAGPAGASA